MKGKRKEVWGGGLLILVADWERLCSSVGLFYFFLSTGRKHQGKDRKENNPSKLEDPIKMSNKFVNMVGK